ncbi:MAG: hypothetical protein LBH98_09235 [Chitinispirillales bacterium]|jgi:hypothetical protein|nr:hypothetical protein [Chitinispirillales bacterium]
MSECTDYWCNEYGKANGNCDRCEKKENAKDESNMRVILKKRAEKVMELDKLSNKNFGQNR